jgi:hypothetical protein
MSTLGLRRWANRCRVSAIHGYKYPQYCPCASICNTAVSAIHKYPKYPVSAILPKCKYPKYPMYPCTTRLRGGCNNPLQPLFWDYDPLGPLQPPSSGPFGPPDPIQIPTPHRLPWRLLRCLPLPWHAARLFCITACCARRHRVTSPATVDSFHRRCAHA